MRRVLRSEILPLGDYELVRDSFRSRIIALKRARRFTLSPEMSLVFENHDTLLWQVQEILRAERITAERAIESELDVYNELLEEGGGLAATLFIEILDRDRRDELLSRLCAIEEHVELQLQRDATSPRHSARATFEEGRRDKGRAAAVQYLKFPLSTEAKAALRSPTPTANLVFDHPAFSEQFALSAATVAGLAEDLD